MKRILLPFFLLIASLHCLSVTPRSDMPTWEQLDGSMMPLSPDVFAKAPALPDSLRPVMLNHVGRHGARFLTSASRTSRLLKRLARARSVGKLTARGEEFAGVLQLIDSLTGRRWGALDSLGMAQQAAIGGWLDAMMPKAKGNVKSVATWVPRVVMSMYSCLHALQAANSSLETEALAGHRFDPLLRFFTTDSAFLAYHSGNAWRGVLGDYQKATLPEEPARRLISGLSPEEARSMSSDMYAAVRGFASLGRQFDRSRWFSYDEYFRCWKVDNLGHWLLRTRNSLGSLPAEIARPLLIELMESLTSGRELMSLRFGHAETLMPLLSLMGAQGCDAPDVSPDDVWKYWRDYEVVPLGASLVLLTLRAPGGALYVASFLNGAPVSPAPGIAPLAPLDALIRALSERLAL